MMLHKAKSKNSTMFRALWALPIIALCLVIHACGEKAFEPLISDGNYMVVKTFDLPNSPSSTHDFKMLANDSPLKFELKEGNTNTTFQLVDSTGNILAESIDNKINYKSKAYGNYRVLAKSNGSNLTGKIEVSALVIPKKPTADGFPNGFETTEKHNIGKKQTEEFTVEVSEGENFSMLVFDKNKNTENILVEVKNAEGKMLGRNFFSEKYYQDMTLKCRESEKLTVIVTFKEDMRPAKLWFAKRSK